MSELTLPGNRINVGGTSGCGKSTLSASLGLILDIPHIELDSLNHMPGWTIRPNEEFRALVSEAISQEKWVVDGNYSRARDLVLARADTLILLDYPLPLILARLTRRTFRRWSRNEVLWGVNRESLWKHFFTRDSLYLWVLQTYRRRRQQALDLIADPQNRDKTVLHFKSPSATDEWTRALAESRGFPLKNLPSAAASRPAPGFEANQH